MDDIKKSLLLISNSCCLEERGEHGLGVLEFVEFQNIIVIKDDVVAQDSLLNILWFAGDITEAAIGKGEDSDGPTAVDFVRKVGLGKEVIEFTEIWVLAEEAGDIEGGGGGGEEEDG